MHPTRVLDESVEQTGQREAVTAGLTVGAHGGRVHTDQHADQQHTQNTHCVHTHTHTQHTHTHREIFKIKYRVKVPKFVSFEVKRKE